jgi:hypothetical protein
MDFTQWLPDPTTTSLRDGYEVLYFDIGSIRARQESIHETAYARLERQMLRAVPREYIDVTDVDAAIRIEDARLALGSFDPEAVERKLTSDRRSSPATSTRTSTTATQTTRPEPEQYRGFDLYGTESVYAVSEDVLMEVSPFGVGETDAVEYTKAIIDASTPETRQYADSNEYVAAMTDIVDDTHAFWCYPEAMNGKMSRGFRKDSITGKLQSWRFGPRRPT